LAFRQLQVGEKIKAQTVIIHDIVSCDVRFLMTVWVAYEYM